MHLGVDSMYLVWLLWICNAAPCGSKMRNAHRLAANHADAHTHQEPKHTQHFQDLAASQRRS
eukprot:1158414-Pelagomonas_calceolata.AAC.3